MKWFICYALPLPAGAHECWFSNAGFACEADSAAAADALYRANAGYGPEVVVVVIPAERFGW